MHRSVDTSCRTFQAKILSLQVDVLSEPQVQGGTMISAVVHACGIALRWTGRIEHIVGSEQNYWVLMGIGQAISA
jgi:hypothetical protein